MVTSRRSRRSARRAGVPPDGAERGSLADLAPGQRGRVRGLQPQVDAATARRLRDLGFLPGSPVTVLRRAPLGDPVVYRLAGTELSLRRTEALRVAVEVEP